MKFERLKIRKVLNTKSNLTIEVEGKFNKGRVRGSVPAGTSAGKHEVVSLPVDRVIRKFKLLKKKFEGVEFSSLEEVDSLLHEIDGTENFSKIGGNLALAISYVFLKGFALNEGLEVFEYLGGKKLPKPLCNVAGGWGKESEIQEYLIYPKVQRSIAASIFKIAEVYRQLGKMFKKYDKTFNMGKNYESAWAVRLDAKKILTIISKAIEGKGLVIGLDVAASDRWDGKTYVGRSEKEHYTFLKRLVKRFGIGYVEDPFHEDDFETFAKFTKEMKRVMVCGDDLLVTNVKRLETALKNKSVNTVLVKPNQIGTVSDTIAFVKMAKKHGLKTVLSHRSGETDDAIIAHLAVGLETDYAKFGTSGERVVKLNELIRIEEKIKG
ncbi:MAG: enolase [Candidatus Aenigmarchaeota archaeon]|nr:enolase [Candidatus Aenigmarchaeota archaeon]